jgi:hypothetical protein
MKYTEGGCLCGAIRYRVTGAPSSSIICHCRTCRKANAAPSVGWLTFDHGSFTLLRGTPRSFSSSSGVARTFCVECGTPLTYANDVSPSEIDVTTISLDDESIFPPTREVWLSHKVTWEPTDPSLKGYPKGTSEDANQS